MSNIERLELDREVDQLKNMVVIEDSQSALTVPVFLVKKPGNQYRMVVEYRKLNENMEPERYPLPLVATIFNTLNTAKYISSMDINSQTAFRSVTGRNMTHGVGYRHKKHFFHNSIFCPLRIILPQ